MIAVALALGLIAVLPHEALAQAATTLISEGLQEAGTDVYSQELTVSVFIGNLIRTLLAATGIVFLVITVYAGILYMTAAGEDTKIKKAKGMLTSSVIGIIIIVGAYAITSYVVGALDSATSTSATEELAS